MNGEHEWYPGWPEASDFVMSAVGQLVDDEDERGALERTINDASVFIDGDPAKYVQVCGEFLLALDAGIHMFIPEEAAFFASFVIVGTDPPPSRVQALQLATTTFNGDMETCAALMRVVVHGGQDHAMSVLLDVMVMLQQLPKIGPPE